MKLRERLEKKYPPDSFWGKLLKNTSTVILGQGGASLVNMVTLFVIVAMLGAGNYGALVLGQAYMETVDALINFQSWQGVIKFGSESLVSKRDDSLASIIKTCMCIDLVSALLGFISSFMLVNLVGQFAGWSSEVITIASLFCLEILVHVDGTPIGVLRLFDRFDLLAAQSVVTAIVKFVCCAFGLLVFDLDLIAFSCLYVATDVIKHLTLFAMALYVLKKRLGIARVAKARIGDSPKGLIGFTIWTNLAATFDVPIKYFDVFFLNLISTEIVGVYKFFKQLLVAMGLFVNPISQAIMPQLSDLIARGKRKEAFRVVLVIRNKILKVLSPLALIAAVLGPFVLGYIFGEIYLENAPVFVALLALNVCTLSYIAIHPCFSSFGWSRQSALITLFSNVIYFAVTYYLISLVGIYGVLLGSFIQFLVTVSSKTLYIKRHIGESNSID